MPFAYGQVECLFGTKHFRHLDLRLKNRLLISYEYRHYTVHADREVVYRLRMGLQQADMKINIRSHFGSHLKLIFGVLLPRYFNPLPLNYG